MATSKGKKTAKKVRNLPAKALSAKAAKGIRGGDGDPHISQSLKASPVRAPEATFKVTKY